jgi:hypothetical protein
VCNVVDFEVIEIVDENTPYRVLLGIDWEFDIKETIDIKKRHMVFKVEYLRVTVLLHRIEGRGYVEPTKRK